MSFCIFVDSKATVLMAEEIITFPTIHDYAKFMNSTSVLKGENFVVYEINMPENQHLMRMGPFRYGFYELVFTVDYHERVTIGNVSFESKNKDILSCTAPGQVISWQAETLNQQGRGYVILFTPEFLHPHEHSFVMWERYPIFSITRTSYYEFSIQQREHLLPLLDTLYKEFYSDENSSLSICSAYLQIILLKINELLNTTSLQRIAMSRSDEITIRLTDEIRQFNGKNLTVANYAERLNISAVYLAECVKKSSGKTVKEFINYYVVLEAKSLLLQTNLPIEEVADRLHFSSHSNFVKFFKKKCDETPSAFRKGGQK